MKKIIKLFLLLLLGALVVMQFFRPKKNIHKGPEATANNISKIIPVPENISLILEKACNDCHSNNTKYPWYSEIMPVGWILSDHVKNGIKELNFDQFATYTPKRQRKKLEEVADEVKEGKMPISSYKRIHKSARLTEEEKTALVNWATDAGSKIVVPAGEPGAANKPQ